MSIEAKYIIQGWSNLIWKDDNIEKEAKRKADICAECPYSKMFAFIAYCGKCGCPLAAKLRSDKKCDLNKF